MVTSKVTSQFQVEIPLEIRKNLNIQIGQEVQIIQYFNRIEIIPIMKMSEMRGYLKGLENNFTRDESDRL